VWEIDCTCGHENYQHFGAEGYGCVDCPRDYCLGNVGRIPDDWDEYVAAELAY
jgi:hypothetical protein